MNKPADLYEQDFVLWAEEQARALRQAAHSGANLPLDWENLAEEIESLGRRDRRELRSRIQRVIEHLLKLECSPALDPRPGWRTTIRRERQEIEMILEDSPSLRRQVGEIVSEKTADAIESLEPELASHGELTEAAKATLASVNYGPEQVLGDWWPDTKA
jgi:hypothetical protein